MTAKKTEIIKAIEKARNVLVCGHIRPDGDCVGSAMFMRRLCEKFGKNADAVCDAEKPESFGFLPQYEFFCAPRFKKYDLIIAVDCATDKRLGEYCGYLASADKSINIDHHPTNNEYADINVIDGSACSTCAILYKLFCDETLNGERLIDAEMAAMLYTGLSTDTGNFMHSNTTAEVFDIAHELCAIGVDVASLAHEIYCNKSFKKIKLTARVLDGIILYEEGKIALMYIGLDDLNACGCKTEDTEGLIDYASSISGVQISIAICEQKGNLYRVSFRSVSADVAAAAGTFGGGGHKLAAGCVLSGNRYDVTDKILSAAKAALCKTL